MLHINDVGQYSIKIAHEENGDKAFHLRLDTVPPCGNTLGIFCVIDGVSTQNPAQSSALAQARIRSFLSPLLLDADTLATLPEEEQERYFFSILRQAILSADQLLFEQTDVCGCTVSLAVLFGNRLYTANVGDSPMYLVDCEAETLTEVYTCHNVVGAMVQQGEITKEEARHTPGKNRLTRVVGGQKACLLDTEVSTQCLPLPSRFLLLLGSDGSLGCFEEEPLKELALSRQGDMSLLCDRVREQVLTAGGRDDSTLLAVAATYTA